MKRSLFIVDVVVRFHPCVGGVENTVLELNRRLVARGHRVRVVCADDPAGSPDRVQGVEVVRLPWLGKLGNTNLAWGLRRAIRRERPDVLHSQIPTAHFADAAAHASRKMGVPLVLTYNNDLVGDTVKGLLGNLYNRFLLPGLLDRCAHVVTINPDYATRSPHLGTVADRITCIPWGVDESVFQPPADGGPPEKATDLVVGFLSLLDDHHHYKGLEVLLRAVGDLSREGRRIRLRVGGAGDRHGFYPRLAAELGVASATSFLGFIPATELPGFFGSCHVFVLPSTDERREGFGLVLLEAMSCARAVVATPVVGMYRDIEGYQAGLLVPPRDPTALAAALRRLDDQRGLLAALGTRGRQLVMDRYTWSSVTDAYEELYLRAARPGPATTSSSK